MAQVGEIDAARGAAACDQRRVALADLEARELVPACREPPKAAADRDSAEIDDELTAPASAVRDPTVEQPQSDGDHGEQERRAREVAVGLPALGDLDQQDDAGEDFAPVDGAVMLGLELPARLSPVSQRLANRGREGAQEERAEHDLHPGEHELEAVDSALQTLEPGEEEGRRRHRMLHLEQGLRALAAE